MVIGMAGRICSGKNHVCAFFEKKGFKAMDLDIVAHDVLDLCSDDLVKAYGPSILKGSRIDRPSLAREAFRDERSSRLLDSITHPRILEAAKAVIASNPDKSIILNGALLHRCAMDRLCDYVVLVWAPYCVRLRRSKLRQGLSPSQFRLRNAQQRDVRRSAYRPRQATFVLYNCHGDKAIGWQVDRICARITGDCERKGNV